ncbi:hypothetical protein L484_020334 [Morus notabilis]|uniref:Uncharacterized protein n=1 Tax=Morus notabilis TaxID=981085 RepID=W9RFB1_9ROSA|nr:hypothetical protein L484_020334 [Morus notabilis]
MAYHVGAFGMVGGLNEDVGVRVNGKEAVAHIWWWHRQRRHLLWESLVVLLMLLLRDMLRILLVWRLLLKALKLDDVVFGLLELMYQVTEWIMAVCMIEGGLHWQR